MLGRNGSRYSRVGSWSGGSSRQSLYRRRSTRRSTRKRPRASYVSPPVQRVSAVYPTPSTRAGTMVRSGGGPGLSSLRGLSRGLSALGVGGGLAGSVLGAVDFFSRLRGYTPTINGNARRLS